MIIFDVGAAAPVGGEAVRKDLAAVRPGAEHCSQALAAMRGFVERTAPPPEEAR